MAYFPSFLRVFDLAAAIVQTVQLGVLTMKLLSRLLFIAFSAASTSQAVASNVDCHALGGSSYCIDTRSWLVVYRPSNSTFYIDRTGSHNPDTIVQFGAPGDVGLIGDINGDNKLDLVLYRAGQWIVSTELSNTVNSGAGFIFGGGLTDIPLLGDVDGDGIDDAIIFRDGTWFVRSSANNNSIVSWPFGAAGDKPYLYRFGGDTKLRPGVYRAGAWYAGTYNSSALSNVHTLGGSTDLPLFVTGGYGTFGYRAIFRNGAWFVGNGNGDDGVVSTQFQYGAAGDIPIFVGF